MGKAHDEIDERWAEWIGKQHMFFVATAPLSADGLINLSPKGLDTFRILGPTEVAYLDLTGSGVETIAHLRENGRITIQFCAFEGPPMIFRIYGQGTVVWPGDSEFTELIGRFPAYTGVRSIIRVQATRIAESCGFAVPQYAYQGHRDQLLKWSAHKGEAGIRNYQQERNAESLDGLPGWEG
jgi:hypothetical protein